MGTFHSDIKPIEIYTLAKDKKDYFFIINVDGKNKPGSHWLAVAKLNNVPKYIIYDSFARPSAKLIPNFIKRFGYKYLDINKKADQLIKEDNCGQRAISFLLFIRDYGYTAATYI